MGEPERYVKQIEQFISAFYNAKATILKDKGNNPSEKLKQKHNEKRNKSDLFIDPSVITNCCGYKHKKSTMTKSYYLIFIQFFLADIQYTFCFVF